MKLFLGLVALLAIVTVNSHAAVNPPRDTNGNSLSSIDWVGATPCTLLNSTAQLCFSGRGAIYGVVVSSDSGANYVIMRDSDTANSTSSSFTVVNATGSGANASGVGTTQMMKFPVPVQVSNGLSVNLGNNPPVGGQWMILYRKLEATE